MAPGLVPTRPRARRGRSKSAHGPRGRVCGRRPKLTADQAALPQQLYDAREETVQQIVDLFGVPRSTVYGHLDKTKIVPRRPKKIVVPKF
ncbi:helix-turn-helix domain-containing protein [Streptomyces sp. NPDC056835]|uniref:helix-turn-helix domain-containing protein n=1 Tax=Streptomyces sp. NPDC056835 TaxID=3345956 RepID=UPI00369268A1